MENLHEGHREKMYRRIRDYGMESLADHEVLETLLYITNPRVDTNPIAHALIRRFGSFSGVLDAKEEELCAIPGVGPKSAKLLSELPAYMRRYMLSAQAHNVALFTSEDMGRYFLPYFVGQKKELVYVLCLDNRYRPIICKCIHYGNVNAVEISVRAVALTALSNDAQMVVLAHNHPGGVALPSEEDIKTTRLIQKVLEPLHIELVDHILVSEIADGSGYDPGDFVSFYESGYIQRAKPTELPLQAAAQNIKVR